MNFPLRISFVFYDLDRTMFLHSGLVSSPLKYTTKTPTNMLLLRLYPLHANLTHHIFERVKGVHANTLHRERRRYDNGVCWDCRTWF